MVVARRRTSSLFVVARNKKAKVIKNYGFPSQPEYKYVIKSANVSSS